MSQFESPSVDLKNLIPAQLLTPLPEVPAFCTTTDSENLPLLAYVGILEVLDTNKKHGGMGKLLFVSKIEEIVQALGPGFGSFHEIMFHTPGMADLTAKVSKIFDGAGYRYLQTYDRALRQIITDEEVQQYVVEVLEDLRSCCAFWTLLQLHSVGRPSEQEKKVWSKRADADLNKRLDKVACFIIDHTAENYQ